MNHSPQNNVEEVVKQNLCLCCGVCLAVCPKNAIVMIETFSGLLVPKVDNSVCNGCLLCLKVCPGTHLEKGLLSPQTDPFKGNCLAAYCGQAADAELLRDGQSGGVVTALIEHLLNSGSINKTVITQMPEDGSLRPVCFATSDADIIRKSGGSKYCPVPLAAVAQKALTQNEKIAVVGVSCHIHGLANSQSHLSSPSPLKIGVICDRILTFGAIDYLVDKAGISRDGAASFQFRSKKFNGWPGDVCVGSKNGKEFCVANRHRLAIKDFYTPARCRLCFDKMNVLCDLVVGDAWGIRESPQGFSVVIARTTRGHEAILSSQKAGKLKLCEIDVGLIFNAQGVKNKRRDWTAFMTIWRNSGRHVPDFNFDLKWHDDVKYINLGSYRKKIEWAMKLSNMDDRVRILNKVKKKVAINSVLSSVSFRGLKKMLQRALGHNNK